MPGIALGERARPAMRVARPCARTVSDRGSAGGSAGWPVCGVARPDQVSEQVVRLDVGPNISGLGATSCSLVRPGGACRVVGGRGRTAW
jgi:hypothetical protein